MINIIVGLVTAIAFVFLLVWIFRPSFRKWVELPKYTMLANDERFRQVKVHDESISERRL